MKSLNWQAIYVMWLRQMKRFIRARSRLIANIVQPFFFLAIFGLGFNQARFSGIPSSYNYMDFLAPGMVTMAVLFSSMFAGVSVIWDKEFGFLKEVLVAPIRRISIVLGRTLGGATTSLIQGFIVMFIAFLLNVNFSLLGILPAIIFMILISFSAVGFGLVIASKMEDIHGFQLIMNLIIFPLFFLSTAFFPLSGVPEPLKFVIYLDPLTYGVDGLRGVLIGFSYIPVFIDFIVVLGVCVLMMSLGSYFFGKCEV